MTEKSKCATTVAALVTELLAASGKTQRQVAAEVGLESPSLIKMLKDGTAKLPVNLVASLAKALNADPAHLLRVTMLEYMPDVWAAVTQNLGIMALTVNELDAVRQFRLASNDKNPPPVTLYLKPRMILTLPLTVISP